MSKSEYDLFQEQFEELQKKTDFAQFRKLGLHIITRFQSYKKAKEKQSQK